jgi:hypothetical protein
MPDPSESTQPVEVVVRTSASPSGDVCGQVVSWATGEILHESSFWPYLWRKDARRDAEQIAQRRGYRVVEVVE